MRQLELCDGRVASLEMFDLVEQLRIVTQRTRYRAQTSDVLRMSPPGVVASAVAVGDERGPHRAGRLLHRSPAAVGDEEDRSVLRRSGGDGGILVQNLPPVQLDHVLVVFPDIGVELL